MDSASKTEQNIFWGLWYKDNVRIFSVRRFFGKNFQAHHKQEFGFCDSSLFLATMTFTRHFEFCDALHVLRSEKQACGHTILKYQEKDK